MVNNTEAEYHFAMANEDELDALLSGQGTSEGMSWARLSKPPKPRPGLVGVVWYSEGLDFPIRPMVLVVNEDDVRRLCGRYAQLHGDLSPLTSWCHLLTPRFIEPLDALVRVPDLGGLQAAWAGLTIAEAVLIAERPLAGIKISACWATYSFAVARTNALWNHLAIGDITRRFDHANRLLRTDSRIQGAEGRATKIRTSLQPIWETLIGLHQRHGLHRSVELEPIISALKGLILARAAKDQKEAVQLVRPLLHYVPEADSFEWFDEIAPEGRLRLFDKLVEALDRTEGTREALRRNGLALLAGYLATVAAGGSPSLALAESHTSRWPEITAWAYLMGGLGEKVVWTSSFDGLGRLVARELQRPLHLDEPPTYDFAFEEAEVLIDSKLADPLVHLKIKQARLFTVQLFPGVNVAVPMGEPSYQSVPRPDTNRTMRSQETTTAGDPISLLVDVMWPHLRARLDSHIAAALSSERLGREEEDSSRSRGKRRSGTPQLPFGGNQKKR